MHGPKWPFLLAHGHSVVVVNCWDMFFTLSRAPRTKESLLDFHEWCRVTRHPRVFRRLTGCQRTPWNWGVTRGERPKCYSRLDINPGDVSSRKCWNSLRHAAVKTRKIHGPQKNKENHGLIN